MISNIKLRNFGPFADAEFDLRGKKGEPLPMALVYGENGSGKTRLFDSVVFLKETAHASVGSDMAGEDDEGTGDGATSLRRIVRRRMMPGSDGMSATYGFLLDGRRFVYSMEFGRDGTIIGESLDGPVASHSVNIFAIGSSRDGPDIRLSPSFLKDGKLREETARAIRRCWGKSTFLGIMNDRRIACDRYVPDSFERFRRYIDSIAVVVPSNDGTDPCQGIVDASDTGKLDAAESAYDSFFRSLDGNIEGVHYRRERTGDRVMYRLVFERRVSGRTVDVDCEDEAEGFRQLARMLPAMAKTAEGCTVLIDGFDSGIHEMMVWELMERIRGYGTGQLIATTHDTELMDDLGPASVYVIRVDKDGFRSILPIDGMEDAERTGSNRNRYLRGCFEGIPYIGDVDLDDISAGFEGEKRIRG